MRICILFCALIDCQQSLAHFSDIGSKTGNKKEASILKILQEETSKDLTICFTVKLFIWSSQDYKSNIKEKTINSPTQNLKFKY